MRERTRAREFVAIALMAACLAALLGFLRPAFGQSAVASGEFAQLEALVAKDDYQGAQRLLKQVAIPEDRVLAWLEEKARNDHVALQFELSARLYPRDLKQSLKWYARGILHRALDVSTCDPAAGVLGRMEDQVADVRSAGIESPDLLAEAIREALSRDGLVEARPRSSFGCLTGSKTYGDDERKRRRAEALQDMQIEAEGIYLFAKSVALGKERNYPVTDTKIVGPNQDTLHGGWLDDRRLLIEGAILGPGESFLDAVPRLLVWDAETGVATTISPPGYAPEQLCVDGKNVVARLVRGPNSFRKRHTSGDPFLLQGRFPDLELVADTRAHRYLKDARYFGCGELPELPHGLTWDNSRALREGHGWIRKRDTGPGLYDVEFIYRRADGEEITLPSKSFKSGQVLAFAAWKGAYLLQGHWRNPRPGVTTRHHVRGDDALLLWLFPDGRIEEIRIPYGTWDGMSPPTSLYRPAQPGLVLAGLRSEHDYLPGFAGVFLFQNHETPVRLLAGRAGTPVVSPDGCRIAAVHKLARKSPWEAETLKIIDVCRETRQ